MTTENLKILLGHIDQELIQLKQCAKDSEEDDNIEHYDCVDDLRDLATYIMKETA